MIKFVNEKKNINFWSDKDNEGRNLMSPDSQRYPSIYAFIWVTIFLSWKKRKCFFSSTSRHFCREPTIKKIINLEKQDISIIFVQAQF